MSYLSSRISLSVRNRPISALIATAEVETSAPSPLKYEIEEEDDEGEFKTVKKTVKLPGGKR